MPLVVLMHKVDSMMTSLSLTDQDKDSGDSSVNVTVQDDGQTWDDIKVCRAQQPTCILNVVVMLRQTMAGKLGQNKEKDQETILTALKVDIFVVLLYLSSTPQFLLNVWAKRLNSRPESEKRSAQVC